MKYIRNYKVFENNTNLTQEQIDFLDNCTRKTWNKPYAYPQPYSTERPDDYLQDVYRQKNPNRTWEVNPNTGLIDVQGSFECSYMNLNDFKGLRFGKVSGDFSCKYNKLKTLDGSPREVGEVFSCFDNPLTSLEGAPLVVRDQFEVRGARIRYNLDAFIEEIKKTDRRFYSLGGVTTIRLPGFNELLLTHHFFTPEVIKQKIQEDNDFLINLLKVWNTLSFEKKQDELTLNLPPKIIQKINDRWINEIKQDDDFCKSFCKYWNTPEFKKKQDELTRTLHPEILQKIKDYSAVVGYL